MVIFFIIAAVVLIAGAGIWFRSGARMPWDRDRR